ncbi:DUF6087 family protein [Streptomyces adustus]|uniref:DUF6087 family protein n=1 Tax=Streptomyces adustus TaxID=1609272 RepID=UPI00371DF3CA
MDGHSRRPVLGPARVALHAPGATVVDPEEEPLERWAKRRDKRLRPVEKRKAVHLGDGLQRAAHLAGSRYVPPASDVANRGVTARAVDRAGE